MTINNINKKLMTFPKKRYTPPLPLNIDIHVDRKKFTDIRDDRKKFYELMQSDLSSVKDFVVYAENKIPKQYYQYAEKLISDSEKRQKKYSPSEKRQKIYSPKEPCYVKTHAASVFKSERIEI